MRELRLGEKVLKDGINLNENTMFISPTGSGKSYFILNDLVKRHSGLKLNLVSTTSLKDSLEGEETSYTTQDLRRRDFNITDENVYIMTYSEFGNKILWNDDFIKDYSVIFCDEIHSLFDYYMTHRSESMHAAIKALFNPIKDVKVFYFTATKHLIEKFADKHYKGIYKKIKTVDYTNDPEIFRNREAVVVSYVNDSELELALGDGSDLDKLRLKGSVKESKSSKVEKVIENSLELLQRGKKGFIFNERIDGMDNLEDMLAKKGLTSMSLWSKNNVDKPMNKEQLKIYDDMISTGLMPDDYDFIIFNGALREGWNLKDERVEVIVLNTLDATNKIQARGRLRRDVSILIDKKYDDSEVKPVDETFEKMVKTGLLLEILGKELSKEDTERIAKELNVVRKDNKKEIKWLTIRKSLVKNGFKVENVSKKVNKKTVRFTLVSESTPVDKVEIKEEVVVEETIKKEVEVEVKSVNKFISSLDKNGFTVRFGSHLNTYLKSKGNGNDRAVAFSNIKANYSKLVLGNILTEEEFLKRLTILAEQEMMFSEDNLVGKVKEKTKETITAKVPTKEEIKAEDELLAYIMNNGGSVNVEEVEEVKVESVKAESKVKEEIVKKEVEIDLEDELLVYIMNNGGM